MFNLNVDKKVNATTVQKGRAIGPLIKFWEVLRAGVYRWPAVRAQGKVTITTLPTDGQIITVGTKVYTWKTTLTNSDGFLQIGATVADCRTNLKNAMNLDGVPSSQYASATTLHPDVEATLITGNDVILTAKVGGTAGNSIALSTTMGGGNSVDGATLGTYRAGVAETDSDGVLTPNYFGNYVYQQTQSSGWAVEYNPRDSMYRAGRGVDTDGNDSDVFLNNSDLRAAFPFGSQYMATLAIRKLVIPNFYDRPHTQLRNLGLHTLLKDLTTLNPASPYTNITSNTLIRTHQLDATRFLMIYNQAAGTTGVYGVVGTTASDGSVTWGTPVLLDDTQATNENFPSTLINTAKFAFGMVHGASSFIHINGGSISGTTITIGTPVQVAAIVSARKDLVKVANDKILVAHIATTNIVLTVVSFSGITASIGSNTTIAGSQPIFVENATDKPQLFYINASSKWSTVAISVVGTTPGTNTPIQIADQGDYDWKRVKAIKLATDKFLFFHYSGRLGGFVNQRTRNHFGIITVSTVTSTLQPEAIRQDYRTSWFGDDTYKYIEEVTAGTEYIFYRYSSPTLSGVRILVNGNNLTIGDMFMKGVGFRDNDGSWPYYRGELWQNLSGQMAMATTSHGKFCFVIQSDTGGAIAYYSDRAFSFDLYKDDDLFGTFTKSLPLLTQPVQVGLTIPREYQFGIKIKNNDTVERWVAIDHAYGEIE